MKIPQQLRHQQHLHLTLTHKIHMTQQNQLNYLFYKIQLKDLVVKTFHLKMLENIDMLIINGVKTKHHYHHNNAFWKDKTLTAIRIMVGSGNIVVVISVFSRIQKYYLEINLGAMKVQLNLNFLERYKILKK